MVLRNIKDTELSLIHIPLHLYPHFLQQVLHLLLPLANTEDGGSDAPIARLADDHPFINISVTPIECSIACPRVLADKLFVPALNNLEPTSREQVKISSEDYVVIQVDGEGLDAGQRVLELTSPLAMAGIPIFFITTYFSDYILVPLPARPKVISALEARGFAFERTSPGNMSHSANPHHRNRSSVSSFDTLASTRTPPGTPPPATVHELQTRTFALLKRKGIQPTVDPSLRLLQCAGSKDARSEERLYLGLVKCLISTPKFLSLTLTDTDPVSLLLEPRLLPYFSSSSYTNNWNPRSNSPHSNVSDVLLGTQSDILIPITLDLRALPMESTGIVCGIAGRLVGGTRTNSTGASVEMSYLSTSKAGNVMVLEEELDRALEALSGVGTENGVEGD